MTTVKQTLQAVIGQTLSADLNPIKDLYIKKNTRMRNKYIKKQNESLDLMRRMGEEVELLKEDSNQGPIKISDYFDISSISEEDIKSITNDMRAFLQGRGFGNTIFWNGEDVITEESQKTLPFDKLRPNRTTFYY